MNYSPSLLPFRFHRFNSNSVVAVSASGDFAFLDQSELHNLVHSPETLPLNRIAELQSKFFLTSTTRSNSTARLLTSRIRAKREMIFSGPSLHIIVPTLICAHSCRYCQVSRTLDSTGYSMSNAQIDAACDTIFESPSRTLTVEFQGGDPLLRFDLVKRAIERISTQNTGEGRRIRFVVATTLHQLDEQMCGFLREHRVVLSTSLDGPSWLHNKNRPLQTKDAYERTIRGLDMARRCIGNDSVSALMTTTKESLQYPEAIVDEYVANGFEEIVVRPLSAHGFARKNAKQMSYSLSEYARFYERAFDRVLWWGRNGKAITEGTARIILNKILSPFDMGYADLQCPTGAGLAVLVYNYDGYVYPSDEARMLAETGVDSLRLGRIGTSLRELLSAPTMEQLMEASLPGQIPGCVDCAFSPYCGPDPIDSIRQFGSMTASVLWTDHCRRHKWLFDFMFKRLAVADEWFEALAHRWAEPECVPYS